MHSLLGTLPSVRRIVAALMFVAAACGGDPTAPSLAGTLGTIPGEVDIVVSSLHQVLAEVVDNPPVLYRRIQDLRLASDAAVLYDRVGRIEAPGLDADLERYTGFVGDLLLATGDLDAAVAVADMPGVALAWLRIEAGAGSLAVGLDPRDCPLVAPAITVDLCVPAGLTGYDAGLEESVRRFLGSYRPVMRLPVAFDDEVRSDIVATLAPEVVAVIDAALEDLVVLTPSNPQVGVHDAFVTHLMVLRGIWSDADASGDDSLLWPTLEADLVAAACDGAEAFAAGRALLGAAEPDSTIPALGAMWFDGEGTGCP